MSVAQIKFLLRWRFSAFSAFSFGLSTPLQDRPLTFAPSSDFLTKIQSVLVDTLNQVPSAPNKIQILIMPEIAKPKLVLAYSGCLDTFVHILKWLDEKGFEVHQKSSSRNC
jgi:hypothetical protein